MDLKTAWLFGSRSFWQLRKNSTTASHLRGAVIGIALSLIPLVVVMVVANGMIEGITYRLIEVFTYHLQVPLYRPLEPASPLLSELSSLPGIRHAHLELSSFALVKAGSTASGAAVRAVAPELLRSDGGFRDNFNLTAGDFNLETLPAFIKKDVFEIRILSRISDETERQLLKSAYTLRTTEQGYLLEQAVPAENRLQLERFFASLKYSTVIIGEALAEKIAAGIGDQVHLLSVISLAGKKIPRSTKLIVTGIFSTGYQDVDRYILYLPLEQGRKILAAENAREYIGIKVTDPFADLSQTIVNLENVLKQGGIRYGAIETWYHKQRYQFESFKSTRTSLIFIMCVIILVAAVNVYSSIHMLVMGKIKEIAIIKSMGARPDTITFAFVMTGFLTGVVGTVIGISLGLLLAVNINETMLFIEKVINFFIGLGTGISHQMTKPENIKSFKILNPDFYLERIPIRISFREVSFIAIFSIFVSILASFLPARNAGKVKPLEIIRRY